MKFCKLLLVLITILAIFWNCSGSESIPEEPRPPTPPFAGTIFLAPDIITSNDPSIYISTEFVEQNSKRVFDRRVNDWIDINAFIFKISFSDGSSTFAVINNEFDTQALARTEAIKYGHLIGQLPKILRKDIDELWIHKGVELFGGGNRSVLIHTGQSVNYQNEGILEETLIHEATHTSLDVEHSEAVDWLSAQTKDNNFISTYAKENPIREDLAESFLLYLAIIYKSDRIPTTLKNTIIETIPNRIQYLNSQNFEAHPFD